MSESESIIDFKQYLEGSKNDFQIAIDDVFAAIENIGVDVEKLKVEISKPDKN